jgi:hypothetical protein
MGVGRGRVVVGDAGAAAHERQQHVRAWQDAAKETAGGCEDTNNVTCGCRCQRSSRLGSSNMEPDVAARPGAPKHMASNVA